MHNRLVLLILFWANCSFAVAEQEAEATFIKHFRANSEITFPAYVRREYSEKGGEPFRQEQAPFEIDQIPVNGAYESCTESNIKKIKLPEESSDSMTTDWLFMQTNIPEDTALMLGTSVIVLPYDPEKRDGLNAFLKGSEAKCLPFRIRTNKKTIYLMEGEDALKNYDKSDKGELHAFFK